MSEKELINESILLDSIPDLKRVHFFEEIESTSDFGKQLATRDDQFPALIYARHQTKGRGRGVKKWVSDGNSMTFSFVLAGNAEIPLTSQSSLVWGMALAKTLNDLSGTKVTFKIKWPNDIMAGEAKVAGILIESILNPKNVQVVGIGINLNNDSENLVSNSEDEIVQAISVKEATGKDIKALELLQTLWTQFVCYSSMSMSDLRTTFQTIDFLESSKIQFQNGQSIVTGDYQGIQDDGSIRLLVQDKAVVFQSGSVLKFTKRN